MPITPITAPYRITVPVTVDGLAHEQRFYCAATGSIGAYVLTAVGGFASPNFYVAAEELAVKLSHMYEETISLFGTILLEQKVGGVYNPVDTYSPTAQPDGDPSYSPAGQLTVYFRDTSFKKAITPLMETRFGPPLHNVAVGTLPTFLFAYVNAIIAPTVSKDIGNWLRSRGSRKIIGYVSATATDNRRLRRDRGLI